MSGKDHPERRRCRRVNVKIPIHYREINSNEIIRSVRTMRASECVNISRSGMQFIAGEGWRKQADRLIEAEFIMSGRRIRLIAHIAWSGFDSRLKKFRSGAEFIAIKSGDLEVIGQIV